MQNKRIWGNTNRNLLKIRRHAPAYNFIGDKITGATFRWGETFKHDPICAPWPELADISISNHCTKNCKHCYRDSKNNNSFMSLQDYEYILQCLNHPKWGNVFQVALGGGEPLEHPNFLEIIDITNKYGVVANFTTNGINLSTKVINSIKGKIGALAISIANINNLDHVNYNLLMEEGIRTNIHFLLSNNTIEQAVDILTGKYNEKLEGINAVIFLTFKPSGRASLNDCLILDKRLRKFISLIDSNKCNTRIGFDACFVPVLLHATKVNTELVDACECAFFSVYIDECLNVKPCSFAKQQKHSYSLKDYSFEKIWNQQFDKYRKEQENSCERICKNKELCRGSCSYYDEINFCFSSKQNEGLIN